MEPNHDYYKQKLQANLQITQKLLTNESALFTEVHHTNERLREVLEQLFTGSQAAFALFETFEGKLGPEENTGLVQFATTLAKSNEQLLEVLRSYRELAERSGQNIEEISKEVAEFVSNS